MKFKPIFCETYKPFNINGTLYKGFTFCQTWRPKRDTPKTYKLIGGNSLKIRFSSFDSGTFNIYQNSRKQFVVSMYHDGCFYPYYNFVELIKL